MHACVHAKLLQSYLTLCNPMDCSPQGSSVHGILQARILESVDMPSSRGSSLTQRSNPSLTSPALAGRFFTTSATWEAQSTLYLTLNQTCYLGNKVLPGNFQVHCCYHSFSHHLSCPGCLRTGSIADSRYRNCPGQERPRRFHWIIPCAREHKKD